MSNTKPTNPKDAAATTRLDLSLFPATARAYGALAMTEGDLKYGAYNYRVAGISISVYYAAAGRHLDKFYNGEWADPVTKVPHLASALACIAVMIDGMEAGNYTDDRPPKVDMGKVFDSMQESVAHLQGLFPDNPGRNTEQNNRFAEVLSDVLGPPASDPVGGGLVWSTDGIEEYDYSRVVIKDSDDLRRQRGIQIEEEKP